MALVHCGTSTVVHRTTLLEYEYDTAHCGRTQDRTSTVPVERASGLTCSRRETFELNHVRCSPRFPTWEKGQKNTAEGGWLSLSPSERYRK